MQPPSVTSIERSPANRLGVDYRQVPPRKTVGPILDAHTHLNDLPSARSFFEAAELYGITHVLSMTPLEKVAELREAFAERVQFIAIPRWKEQQVSTAFQRQWIDDLTRFRALGARLCKLWMAPPMRERHGLTLPHEFLRPVIRAALDLGYHFMVHVGDPSVWWRPGARYADDSRFGSKLDQYPQLEWLAEYVAPRLVIAAHMGGFIEDPAFLQRLLDRLPNLLFDSSATKWIVREVARQPAAVRDFILANPDRVLFGTDLVASEKHVGFDHYASRYWAHLQMWETSWRGESPIEDPDAEDPPRLAGLNLPPNYLRRMYFETALDVGLVEAGRSASPVQ
jgi:predicted TIM-barrel fold metal-dependent hydrolase